MRKILLLIVIFMLCVGCTNENNEQKISDFVNNSSYSSIIEKINENVNDVTMFPTKEKEEEFIYYIKAITNNLSKFSKDEIRDIYNKVNINYSFKFNKINYSVDDFRNDLRKIENYMHS